MPLYEFKCENCGDSYEVKQSMLLNLVAPECCERPTRRVYTSINYSMPGAKSEDTWNSWIEGKEAAVGMSRERTQQLARHVYQQTKGNVAPVAPKRSISTPSNPSPHQRLAD